MRGEEKNTIECELCGFTVTDSVMVGRAFTAKAAIRAHVCVEVLRDRLVRVETGIVREREAREKLAKVIANEFENAAGRIRQSVVRESAFVDLYKTIITGFTP